MANARTSTVASFLDEKKSLACVHCGLCLGSCPTYLETGNENDSPRGRIYLMRALESGRLDWNSPATKHLDQCLGCRACEAACPSGVEYGLLLESAREQTEKSHKRSLWQRFLRRVVIEQVFPYPSRFGVALKFAGIGKALRVDQWGPKWARDSLALIPDKCTADTLPELSPATTPEKRGRVGFIRGCVMSVMFGDVNAATVRVLNAAGYDVVTPRAQECCGALHAHSGQLEQARHQARKNIAAFESAGVETIVINAAGCGSTLKEYGHLLADDPEWAARGKAFSAGMRDFSEFLREAKWSPKGTWPGDGRISFHDACHLAHAQRITAQPRALVKAVAGDRFVEMAEADVCCGSAGSYNLTEPEMAERLQKRKTGNILASGAGTVVTTNPGCILQIQAGLKARGAGEVRVVHIAEFLDEACGFGVVKAP